MDQFFLELIASAQLAGHILRKAKNDCLCERDVM
jgi:hypothetical protein